MPYGTSCVRVEHKYRWAVTPFTLTRASAIVIPLSNNLRHGHLELKQQTATPRPLTGQNPAVCCAWLPRVQSKPPPGDPLQGRILLFVVHGHHVYSNVSADPRQSGSVAGAVRATRCAGPEHRQRAEERPLRPPLRPRAVLDPQSGASDGLVGLIQRSRAILDPQP
eukprot:7444753-Pyramimonas_sp.AAC.3